MHNSTFIRIIVYSILILFAASARFDTGLQIMDPGSSNTSQEIIKLGVYYIFFNKLTYLFYILTYWQNYHYHTVGMVLAINNIGSGFFKIREYHKRHKLLTWQIVGSVPTRIDFFLFLILVAPQLNTQCLLKSAESVERYFRS